MFFRKRKIVLVTGILVLLLTVYFRSMIGAAILRSEKIEGPELRTMLNCALFPVKGREVEVNGNKYFIPLPRHSAEYASSRYPEPKKGKQYLTSTKDLERYLKKELPQYGWEWKDQLGSLVIVKRVDNEDALGIDMTSFTHFYLKLMYH
ncbi:MAG: hypothetical protein N2484_04925 [Clostridia bacterium]|nr:hypothetical protein [Clostridia bacterium]